VDDAVGSPKKGDGGTNFYARSVIAMIAAEYSEVPARIRVAAFFDVLHPGAIHAHRDVMLFLTGNRAGVTADATILIDDKSVAHFIPFELENLLKTTENFHLDSREKREGSTDVRRNSLVGTVHAARKKEKQKNKLVVQG